MDYKYYPEESAITQDMFGVAMKLLEKWKPLLRLDSWDIKMRIESSGLEVTEKNCIATIQLDRQREFALLTLAHPDLIYDMYDLEDYEDYDRAVYTCIEPTIVHELMHIHFDHAEFDLEESVDSLTRVVIALNKGMAKWPTPKKNNTIGRNKHEQWIRK